MPSSQVPLDHVETEVRLSRFGQLSNLEDSQDSSSHQPFEDAHGDTLDDSDEAGYELEEDEDMDEDLMQGLDDGDAATNDASMRGFTDEFEYLAATKSAKLTVKESDAIKKLFIEAWKERDLNLSLLPQDMALGIAKMKIDLYEYDMNSSIGTLATNHIKGYKSEKYQSEFRFWSRKYTAASRRIEARSRQSEEDGEQAISIEKKKMIMEAELDKMQIRNYDDWKTIQNTNRRQYHEGDGMARAKMAGDRILQIARDAMQDPDLQMKDLSIAQIEVLSRSLMSKRGEAKDGRQRVSPESIKKYLKRYLNKKDADINEFSRLRLDYKLSQHIEKKRVKPRRAKKRQDERQ